jgi:predicted TIM-barrel fold metal-dependent hydrolase
VTGRRAVDAHNHLGRWLSRDPRRWDSPRRGWVPTDLRGGDPGIPWAVDDVPALLALLDARGVETVVNLDGRWGAELEANLERYDRAAPGRFATFCQLDWSRAAAGDDFGVALAQSLRRSAGMGARGLKVWKTLGLGWRDTAGRLLLPDDPRIGPVWAQAAELGMPVLIHTGDPRPCFAPPTPRNPLLLRHEGHPDTTFYGGDLPSFERLREAFEAMLAEHRQTTFVGAHLAQAERLGELAAMLAEHPNLQVDVSIRLELLAADPNAARELLERHAERVLFGTDVFPPSGDAYARWFELLERVLRLPETALEAICGGNARRLLGQLGGPL